MMQKELEMQTKVGNKSDICRLLLCDGDPNYTFGSFFYVLPRWWNFWEIKFSNSLVVKPNHEEMRGKEANSKYHNERQHSHGHLPSRLHLRMKENVSQKELTLDFKKRDKECFQCLLFASSRSRLMQEPRKALCESRNENTIFFKKTLWKRNSFSCLNWSFFLAFLFLWSFLNVDQLKKLSW